MGGEHSFCVTAQDTHPCRELGERRRCLSVLAQHFPPFLAAIRARWRNNIPIWRVDRGRWLSLTSPPLHAASRRRAASFRTRRRTVGVVPPSPTDFAVAQCKVGIKCLCSIGVGLPIGYCIPKVAPCDTAASIKHPCAYAALNRAFSRQGGCSRTSALMQEIEPVIRVSLRPP